MYSKPLAISRPSDGSVTGTPRPRKDSVASSAMARATCTVATTISGGRQLGSRWRNTMRARRQREAARRLDVFLAPLDQRRAAHGARVVGPLHRDQRDDDLVDALAQDREQDQRDQDRRERQLDVDDAHDQRLDPAADIGRDQARPRCRWRARSPCSIDADAERDAQAVEDRRQHVAALVVGAEPERAAGRAPASRRQLACP